MLCATLGSRCSENGLDTIQLMKWSVWVGMLAAGSGAVAQAPETPEVRGHESAPSFRIRVETNVVTVPVVVRDRNGRPVGNLEKQDFAFLITESRRRLPDSQ